MAALCVCLTCLPYLSQVKASPALGRVVAQLLVPDPAKRPSAEELVSISLPYMSALYVCLIRLHLLLVPDPAKRPSAEELVSISLPYMSALYVCLIRLHLLLVPDPAKRPSAEELVSMLEPAPYMSALYVFLIHLRLP